MKRLPMRKIREALRLRADGLSGRQMALSLSLGRATVSDYLRRADVAGLSWPLPADLSDGDIEGLLFPRTAGDVCGSYRSRWVECWRLPDVRAWEATRLPLKYASTVRGVIRTHSFCFRS